MATLSFNAGVYNSDATKTVNSSLTLSGANTATSGDSTVFPDLTGSVNAVGPEHRRKYLLGY